MDVRTIQSLMQSLNDVEAGLMDEYRRRYFGPDGLDVARADPDAHRELGAAMDGASVVMGYLTKQLRKAIAEKPADPLAEGSAGA